jgi:tyramine---L-glutamate ligase
MVEPGAGVEGRPTTVFVYEYVTGGGLAGQDLPPSWAAEGGAMRRAIVEDFAAVPGVRVVTTVDARLRVEAPPGVDVHLNFQGESHFEALAAEADLTLVIAPETDGILARLAGKVEELGGRLLGPGRVAVEFLGDKLRLANFLGANGIDAPPTLPLGSRRFDPPGAWGDRFVVKPRWGAGSVDTRVCSVEVLRQWKGTDRAFVAQPFLPGTPKSASVLVDSRGDIHLLAVGFQMIEFDENGRISYGGGFIPAGPFHFPWVVRQALEVARSTLGPSLRGFVGIDYLADDGVTTVLEINPRPTTSLVGLCRRYPRGAIARAWLDAIDSTYDGEDLGFGDQPESGLRQTVYFAADGTIHPPQDFS